MAIWVVNAGISHTPAGACGNAPSATSTPYLISKSPIESSKSRIWCSPQRAAPWASMHVGRQSATSNPTTSVATLTVQLTSASSTCVASGGSVRCLNVIVSPGGDARICDPARSGAPTP